MPNHSRTFWCILKDSKLFKNIIEVAENFRNRGMFRKIIKQSTIFLIIFREIISKYFRIFVNSLENDRIFESDSECGIQF